MWITSPQTDAGQPCLLVGQVVNLQADCQSVLVTHTLCRSRKTRAARLEPVLRGCHALRSCASWRRVLVALRFVASRRMSTRHDLSTRSRQRAWAERRPGTRAGVVNPGNEAEAAVVPADPNHPPQNARRHMVHAKCQIVLLFVYFQRLTPTPRLPSRAHRTPAEVLNVSG